jgi:hypothetical protein
MATVGSLNIGVSASTQALEAGLKRGAAQVEGFASRVQGVGSRFSGVFAGIAAGAAAWGITSFLGDSIRAASDLNESLSAIDSLLGKASEPIKAFAADLSERFGLVRKETIDTASGFAALGKGLGELNGKELTDFATKFTKLTADLSSNQNLAFGEAAAALRVQLSGEQSDMLKRLGVVTTETALKQYALAHGITAAGQAMTESQKLAARMGIITEKLAFANGDLERTFAGVANQARGMSGRIEELKVSVGEAIQPVTAAFLEVANVGVKAVSDAVLRNQGEIKAWADSIAASIRGATSSTSDWSAALEVVNFLGRAIGASFRFIEAAASDLVNGVAEKFQWMQKAMQSAFSVIPGVKFTKDPFWDQLRDVATRQRDVYWQSMKDTWNGTQRATKAIQQQAAAVQQLAQQAPAAATLAPKMDAQAAATAKAADEAERLAKAQEAMASRAKSIFEETRTPLEQFQTKIGELRQLFGAKLIDPDTFQRSFKAAFDQLNGPQIEAAKRAREEMASQAEAVRESIATPLQRLEAERTKLEKLSAAGLLTTDETARALDKSKADLGISGEPTGTGDRGPRSAAALEAGSAEARSAILNHRIGGDTTDVVRVNREQLAVQKQLLVTMQAIARKKPEETKVLSFGY